MSAPTPLKEMSICWGHTRCTLGCLKVLLCPSRSGPRDSAAGMELSGGLLDKKEAHGTQRGIGLAPACPMLPSSWGVSLPSPQRASESAQKTSSRMPERHRSNSGVASNRPHVRPDGGCLGPEMLTHPIRRSAQKSTYLADLASLSSST